MNSYLVVLFVDFYILDNVCDIESMDYYNKMDDFLDQHNKYYMDINPLKMD